MNTSKIGPIIEPLREMVCQFDTILKGYRERNNVITAGIPCDCIPPEVLASFDVIPLRVPSFLRGKGCADGHMIIDKGLEDVYNFFIVPVRCRCGTCFRNQGLPCYEFAVPEGFGEGAALKLHDEIGSLLERAVKGDIKKIDTEKLKKVSEDYNGLRRLMRGIASVRKSKPDLLSHEDMGILIEAASIFPPFMVAQHCAAVLQKLNETAADRDGSGYVQALVYSGYLPSGPLLDDIEDAGCLVAEDDTCNGLRQFDLSINTGSESLLREILDAFTYKPFCASLRNIEERYELLYKLLKSYGIEVVIFLQDGPCETRIEEIEFLRKKMMRAGIDPLVVDSSDAVRKVSEYLAQR